ncbi:radical SAM protein [Paraburkholderia sp. SARCC-3016]|nr:radical SAM protein [Paraburkholderia sp. SARCC-3016]
MSDAVSGVKYVLDRTGIEFFRIFEQFGDTPGGVDAIAQRFLIDINQARRDYDAFLRRLDQAQHCRGSTLPGQYHAVLEPTAGCNGGCPHCYHSNHKDQWPLDRYDTVLEQLERAGIRSVSITGGEVFSTHFVERFFPLVDRLRERGFSIASVSTNATFVTETVRDRILAEISKDTVFRISLDAVDSDLLDRVRPGYRKLADPYGPIADLDNADYNLVFTTNLSVQTVTGVLEIAEHLRRYSNITTWNVRSAVPMRTTDIDRASQARAKRIELHRALPDPSMPIPYYHAILERHADTPFAFDILMGNFLTTSSLAHPAVLEPRTGSNPCHDDEELMVIKANGMVSQCPALPELDSSLQAGSLFEPNDALELSRDYAQHLPLAGLDTTTMVCRNCEFRSFCGGGCRLYSLAYGQTLTGCDLPAKALLDWIKDDESLLFRRNWPAYHARFVSMIGS